MLETKMGNNSKLIIVAIFSFVVVVVNKAMATRLLSLPHFFFLFEAKMCDESLLPSHFIFLLLL
jgi:hypothetical protein